MSRKRENKLCLNLPRYVTVCRGEYVFRPYDPQTKKKGKQIRLSAVTEPISVMWARYEQVTASAQVKTLEWAIAKYMQSVDFKRLAPRSIVDGNGYFKRITNMPMAGGTRFGEVDFELITTGTLQRYLDKRSSDAPVSANKEIGFLSTVYNWHIRRDNIRINAASKVKKNKTTPRTRYVTDEEYAAALKLAKDAPAYVFAMMEIAFLCRARRVEIRELKRENITEKGLMLNRHKGSKSQIIALSDRLKHALNYCNSKAVSSVFVVHNGKGQPISDSTFKSAWSRMMKKYKELGFEGFTFHDLKAKGVSDFDGDKLKASGHKTQSMLNVYDRKIETVNSTK